jgi:hypothetical protein
MQRLERIRRQRKATTNEPFEPYEPCEWWLLPMFIDDGRNVDGLSIQKYIKLSSARSRFLD